LLDPALVGQGLLVTATELGKGVFGVGDVLEQLIGPPIVIGEGILVLRRAKKVSSKLSGF